MMALATEVRSSWGAVLAELLARVNHVSESDALFWLGALVVVGCIIAAAVAAWRGLWIAVALLVLVAIIAAVLLL